VPTPNNTTISRMDVKLSALQPSALLRKSISPLATEKFNVQRAPELPSHLAMPGKHIAYDEAKETLWLTHEIDELQEQAVMLMLGDQLMLR